jgi:hypothetical protein
MPFVSQVRGRAVLDPDGSRVGTPRDLLVAVELPYPPALTLINHELRLAGVGNSTADLFGGTSIMAHAAPPEAYLLRGEVSHAV